VPTQLEALQKPPTTQALSLVQLVPQVGGGPAAQRYPLQLWAVPATQAPAPLQTLVATMEALVLSHAGVVSHTTEDGWKRQLPDPLQAPVRPHGLLVSTSH